MRSLPRTTGSTAGCWHVCSTWLSTKHRQACQMQWSIACHQLQLAGARWAHPPPPRQGDAKLQWQEFPFRLHLCMLVFSPTIILLVFYFLSLFLLTYKISMYLFAPPYSWLLVKEGNRLPFAAPPVCTVPRALPAFIPVKSPVCLRPCLHGDICSWEGRLFGAGASL